MASGWWRCTTSETNSQSSRSPNSNPMVCPLTSRHAPIRSFMSEIGVRLAALSSWSIVRLTQLSTMTTSWPTSERCREVGQPQYPSPPRTSTFITLAPFLLYAMYNSYGVLPNSNRTCQPTIVAEKSPSAYQIGVNALFQSSCGPARRPRWLVSRHSSDITPVTYPASAILTQLNAN